MLHAAAPLFTLEMGETKGGDLVLAQKELKRLDVMSADASSLKCSIPLSQKPTGMTIRDDIAYVTSFDTEGKLEVISLSTGKVLYSMDLGSGACGPLLSPDAQFLFVCNQFEDSVSRIDLKARKIVGSAKVKREPKHCLLTKDGKFLYVTNFLPHMRADLDVVAAHVSVVDVASMKEVNSIELANGSNAVRGMSQSPDGRYIYVSHNLGRFMVPTSQLQQGWMNTSAFSVIDTEKQECLGTVIVDEPERGSAGIWDIVCNEDVIVISHSGTHEISIIDQKAMLERLSQYPSKETLAYDLRFLYGMRRLVKLEGNGPRVMLLRGAEVLVPTYFADILNIVDIKSGKAKSVNLNPQREESVAQKGEKYFNDAMLCFQNWQSCNGCHPGEGRTDGMNWDLMNDQVGNPKNCKSLLFSHVTPPSMISGIRATAEIAVRKGFTHIQFFEVDEEYAKAVDEYLKGLKPVSSPLLVKGELSDKAKLGRKVFDKLQCVVCHSGPMYTDMKMHRIGDDVEFEKGWDTPTLREVWRTAPYLFDGRAATMKEVFSVHKHGVDQKISEQEAEDLAEYVLSL